MRAYANVTIQPTVPLFVYHIHVHSISLYTYIQVFTHIQNIIMHTYTTSSTPVQLVVSHSHGLQNTITSPNISNGSITQPSSPKCSMTFWDSPYSTAETIDTHYGDDKQEIHTLTPHSTPAASCNVSPEYKHLPQPAQTHTDDSATLILYLEPNKNSNLHRFLCDKSRKVINRFGADSSHCYTPHCSLTSFFSVNKAEVDKQSTAHDGQQSPVTRLRNMILGQLENGHGIQLSTKERDINQLNPHKIYVDAPRIQTNENNILSAQNTNLVSSKSQRRNAERLNESDGRSDRAPIRVTCVQPLLGVEVFKSNTGNAQRSEDTFRSVSDSLLVSDEYVVLPLIADSLMNLIQYVVEEFTFTLDGKQMSKPIRIKRGDHITIANDRKDKNVRQSIVSEYEGIRDACKDATWDLVLNRLTRKSQGYNDDGLHLFHEELRIEHIAYSIV